MGNYESAQQRWTFEHSLPLPFVCFDGITFSIFTINFTSITELHAYIKYRTHKRKLESKTHNEESLEKFACKNTVRFTLISCSTICVCLKLNLIDKIFMPAIISTPLNFTSLSPRKVFKILISNFSISAKWNYSYGAHLPLWSIKNSFIY